MKPIVYAPPYAKRPGIAMDLFINDAAWEIASGDSDLARALPPIKGPDEEVPEDYVRIEDIEGY